jgi:hypothetical protein
MITNDTRLAWALARDDGMRSQHGVIVDKLEVGCDVQVGARGGVGAGVNADYAKVASCIADLPKHVQAAGDAMNCRGVLSYSSYQRAASFAALAAAQMAGQQIKGFPQWSPERQRLLYWLALAAVERSWVRLHGVSEKVDHQGRQEGRTLDEPWKVGKWLRGKHGQSLPLKNWGRDWAAVWDMLKDAVSEMDAAATDAVDDCIHHERKAQKRCKSSLAG